MGAAVRRRSVLAGSLAALAASRAEAARGGKGQDWGGLGREAYAYILPLIEMNAARARTLASGAKLNVLRHVRLLANAQSRAVTTPNNDTLYSSAWLELDEPVEITLPATHGRYFSLALMDAFSNNFAVLHGEPGASRKVRLAGPRDRTGPGEIRAPTTRVWALARTYVAGPQDLAAAHAVQDGLLIAARPAESEMAAVPERADVAAVFAAGNQLLAHTEIPKRDRPLIHRLASAGVGPGLHYPAAGLSLSDVSAFEAGAKAELASLRFGDGPVRGGWIYPKNSLGDFGADYGYRASIALTGLAALPLREAIYLKGGGDNGEAIYDGTRRYRWDMSAAQIPPVDAFWSLALYELTPQGQLFFYDNPQKRYSVGSNTPGLVRGEAGHVSVLISNTAPAPADGLVNWLPAPRGPFALQLRAFQPQQAFSRGLYTPPSFERLPL